MKKTKTYNQVIEVLEANRRSVVSNTRPRDSDKELIIQFLQLHMGMELTAPQIEILRTIDLGSITRTRRKLQQQGLYWGSPEVMAKRRIKAAEMQQVAPNETAAGLQRRMEENL